MLTERGTTFGYQDLVVDYRGIPEMHDIRLSCYPGCHPFIATAQPDQRSDRRNAATDRNHSQSRHCRSVDGIFIETHENPAVAKSDGANMLKLDLLEGLLTKLVRIREAVK